MGLTDHELNELKSAKRLLENPGVAARLGNLIGAPIEKGFDLLPKSWTQEVQGVTQTALLKASEAAIFTLDDLPGQKASELWHKFGVVLTGGLGGFFGIAAIVAELPLSTTIILRSIADIARSEGESIQSVDTKIACLEVFALGGGSSTDDDTETGYFAVRSALAKSVADATEYIARYGITQESGPVLIKFVAKVAGYFGIQVSQKAAAQAIPAIGAAGGALINAMFIDHFQDMARGHFIVRKLERKYGEAEVKRLYETISLQPVS